MAWAPVLRAVIAKAPLIERNDNLVVTAQGWL